MTFRSAVLAATACIFSVPAAAQDALPPSVAWSGRSEKLIVPPSDALATPVERARFASSPSYRETRAWLEHLAAASPLISLETFGQTSEGRDLLYVRASKGGDGKPVVLVQAGIHAGEIDGKDAGLMLLRDIALRDKASLLDKVDLVFVPILNVDGHERTSSGNRPHDRIPFAKGYRANARNLDLNRDYAKLDAPETRAIVALLRRFDPALYIDFHVSDGFDHQYDVTFTYAGWGKYARHRATADWLQTRFDPAVMDALRKAGHVPGVYPSAIDSHDPSKGIRFSPEGPRYSTGYGDFISVPTVLVENHHLKPYRQRVLGSYVLMEAALRLAATDATAIQSAKTKDRASRPADLMTRWQPTAQPIGWIEDFKGIAFETYRSAASGRLEQRWLGRPTAFRMPIIGQTATEHVRLPTAWWVPPGYTDVVERLKLHGIRYDTIDEARTMTLDVARIEGSALQPASEGRIPIQAKLVHDQRQETLPAGSVRVPADQPLGLLAAALLEPESQDSLFAWGFFHQALQPAPGTDDFVLAAMADRRLATDPEMKLAFERKLDSDPAFSRDPAARLAWFHDRLLPSDPYALTYPILREADRVPSRSTSNPH
ncbi:M14 family metallopeptidase [Sphingomonas jeddahensis]|uniref:Zinc carboxypeptidase n=1 Tax=Sphingomonas jeddahensis TaxID=1915074 RepID=A0A1V2EXV3_9SPHN|nr:M14 family metallopeptidase [Sphingomonas jeddahensis]ONF97118.1 Zinc carboxypeptidase [Sphingomonas jeddahensis]